MSSSRRDDDSLAELPVSQKVFDQLMANYRFSQQQQRIVELILRGCTDKEIAGVMGITVPTIRTYVGRIFRRASVEDRMQLVLQLFAESHER